MMKTIVMKFGGAAVATPQKFRLAAQRIVERQRECSRIVAVVSAMGNTTNYLQDLALQVNPSPSSRELDMLLTVGERISIALLAMALEAEAKEAVSFTGSQSGIITTDEHTEAKILDIRPRRILHELERGKIVIVAGFQGVSTQGEITTLGRGGSDTTAVALAVALRAERVEFYKDVPGVFDRDPKKHPTASPYSHLTYEEAKHLLHFSSQFLHHRCLDLAMHNGLPLHVLPYDSPLSEQAEGTVISDEKYRCNTAEVVYECV